MPLRKRYVHNLTPESMNVTLCGERIFTDVIKDLKMFMGQGGKNLIPMISVLIRGRGEGHVETEAKFGVMQPRIKEILMPPEAERSK